MQSQSPSLPTALQRSARVVLQPYHSCRRAPGFKTQQSDGLSLTPSRLSVSRSDSLPDPPTPSNLLLTHTSTRFFSSLAFISALFLCSCSPVSGIFESSHIHYLLHHQFVIPSFSSSSLLFFPLAVTIPLLPCLHSLSPSVFLPFGRLWYLYIKPSLSARRC